MVTEEPASLAAASRFSRYRVIVGKDAPISQLDCHQSPAEEDLGIQSDGRCLVSANIGSVGGLVVKGSRRIPGLAVKLAMRTATNAHAVGFSMSGKGTAHILVCAAKNATKKAAETKSEIRHSRLCTT